MQNKESPPEGRLLNIKTHEVLFPFSRIANADTRDSRIANSGKRGKFGSYKSGISFMSLLYPKSLPQMTSIIQHGG